MNLLNQYSYVFIALVAVVVVYVLLRRYMQKGWPLVLFVQLGIVLVFGTGFVILRPGNSNVSSADAALSMLQNGRPTFVEFFSNYCSGCLSLNPIVEAIVDDIEEDYNILRIDIHTSTGREMREALGFSFTPEFIVYDVSGREIWRDHIPPTQSQLDAGRIANQALSQ